MRHPVAVKAAQGRTKTRLVLDPPAAVTVAKIFTWWVDKRQPRSVGFRTAPGSALVPRRRGS
jgi:hypothetical protein